MPGNGGEGFKRWILLRLAYVLTGMMQKRRTTGGGDKEGVNEEPSPFKGWRNGIQEYLEGLLPVVRDLLLHDNLYHHVAKDAGTWVELE